MAASYHMEALRRQRVIERAIAARIRMENAARDERAIQSVEPPSVSPPQELDKPSQSQLSNRTASAKSRDSNRAVSQHSSQHSRASTAATLTRESQLISPVPASLHGSAVPEIQQLERPASRTESVAENNTGREGSIHGSRSGDSAVRKSREGSRLSKRDTGSANRIGSAGNAEKPKSAAERSVASSKRNSPIPEEGTAAQEVPVGNGQQTDAPVSSHSHRSSRKSNRLESHNKSTNT